MLHRFLTLLILLLFSVILSGCPLLNMIKPSPVIDILPQPGRLEPVKQTDTGGHTGIIRDIIITSDKKQLISCSDDKTVRVWNMRTKKTDRKILGEIGKGYGEILAIALSPDDQFLAVGGFMYQENEIDDSRSVNLRIYYFPTGELICLPESQSKGIYDLCFSPDGRFLVSGSKDFTVEIWDAENDFKLVHTFKEHRDHVYAVKIFSYKEDYRIVSASLDHKVILYSLNRKAKLASFSHGDWVDSLAVSSKYIASSGNDNKINIFNLNLAHKKTIESDTIPSGLAFSPNGKLLLSGVAGSPPNCNIYDTGKKFKKIQTFMQHDNLTLAVAFADNTTAVTGGGINNNIRLWNPRTGKPKGNLSGSGKNVWSVGIKGNDIAFGNTSDFQALHNHNNPLEKRFSLSSFTLTQPKDFSEFKQIATDFQGYSLSHTKGGPYEYDDGVLLVKKGEEIIAKIERNAANGLRHAAYGFTPDGTIISSGAGGFLKAYNIKGDEIADFEGHNGVVWDIAIDKNRLVSGGDDQVIHVWDLNKLKQGKSLIIPSFSFFISNMNQWVIWTPEGFFHASQGGAKFIGYHINRGMEKAAEYISMEQIFDLYFQPALLSMRIQGGHEQEIQAAFTRTGSIDKIVKSGLPPVLEIVNTPASKQKQRNLTLNLKITDQGGGIGRIEFQVNGLKDAASLGINSMEISKTQTPGVINVKKIPALKNGSNTITATAWNKEGNIKSKPVEIVVNVAQK